MEQTKKSEKDWKSKLSEEEYRILREKGTEPAFTGKYWSHKAGGMYHCKGCGGKLFSSDTKFDSGTGWPSFTDPAVKEAVILQRDFSHGMMRTEVLCAKCGGHLGHVFNDGPGTSGKRYCINSACLAFKGNQ